MTIGIVLISSALVNVLLVKLRRDRGLTFIVVSHDLAVISQMCDTVHVFRDGGIVEAGPTRRVLREPRHPYTIELIENHERFGIDRVREQRSRP
ncbi:hypothetical protein [Nonomuraea sp. NPDC050643]|uniref:hypothetical protein n=1 Tax=Nonomuraea sp. NPDC050643 TaxID=3155660 RepID=UPI0033D35068